MTSYFDDIVATFVAPQVMHYFAETGIIDYTSADGTTTEDITAVIGNEDVRTEDTDEGEVKVRRREIWCHRDPTSEWKGIADPNLRGSVTYAGDVWQIDEILEGDETLVHFAIVLMRSHEYTKTAYRRA